MSLSTPIETDVLGPFANRLVTAIEAMQVRIDEAPPEQADAFEIAGTLDAGTRLMLGDCATRGLMAGKLSADEAQTMHRIRTEWAQATTAERIVFIHLAFELLQAGV